LIAAAAAVASSQALQSKAKMRKAQQKKHYLHLGSTVLAILISAARFKTHLLT